MLYADPEGQVYEHPYFRMAGFSGSSPVAVKYHDIIRMPDFSKLFYIPECPPIGLDPETGQYFRVPEIETDGKIVKCLAVAAFLEPGMLRSHLPAVDYGPKSYDLPTWAYTAVGFQDDSYQVAGLWIEHNHKWDPANYDDNKLVPAIERYQKEHAGGALLEHLVNCATDNHCFAAKNLFLERWEAPIPVSITCNAACLGCLSLQTDKTFCASHARISRTPDRDDIVALAVSHLENAPDAIVSFGQGCEGEPLTEHVLIAESITEIRKKTKAGTINLNTNGSHSERIRQIAESGLDSVRISMNSARPDFYHAYYRPRDYDFADVVDSVALARQIGLYTMINYLVFPGITDQPEEIAALKDLLMATNVDFLHLKNLCIDPQLYLEKMPTSGAGGIGMKKMLNVLQEEFPGLSIGYFNQPVR
jgi:pyruvate-formate lyase-activating enzyme